jgi:hypothetical protein
MSAVGVVPLRVAGVCVGKARDKKLAICGVGHPPILIIAIEKIGGARTPQVI